MKTFLAWALAALGLGIGMRCEAESSQPVNGLASGSASTLDQPELISVRVEGTNLVAVASVPVGIKVVTLEGRRRIGTGAWVPRAVARADGTGGEITLRVPMSSDVELLRVRAETHEVLPSFFYHGTNTFAGAPGSSGMVVNDARYDGLGPVLGPTASIGSVAAPRDVVESDIWKVRGNALYFFNQYRGLQVIDLTTPDSPVIRGTFDLPAAGEQMYLIDTNYAVLLVQGCGWSGNNNGNDVVIVDVTGNNLQEVASLPVDGTILESRLVGTALYVASQVYRPVAGSTNNSWESGTMVSSFDLSDPTRPVAKQQLWYSSTYGTVVAATDQFFFLATQTSSWYQSVVQVIDISDPSGVMQARGRVQLAGYVTDKFKMNLVTSETNTVFTVISEAWNDRTRWTPTLQTFSLADPNLPQKLGYLTFTSGEQLHATRFDGDRVYVVTFKQIDPLWVVDLSDPTHPTITGQLQVPGWSTYIEPLGDRLVTIGIETTNSWHIVVSLFDVSNPAQPSLLSRVPLGDNSSWSEATTDEKAFGVFPETGLILVPYQGYYTNGYTTAVQLIDLGANALTLRGVLQHQFQPRRATVYGDRIISISGRDLMSADASDRNSPVIRADLELSWPVDRIFLAGDYLVEIANGGGWNNSSGPTLHVTPAANPDHVLQGYSLTNLPIVGAMVQDRRLYLVQGQAGWYGPPVLDGKGGADATNPPNFFLSVLDLQNLPTVTLLAQTSLTTDALGWSANFQAVWPRPGLLVWTSGGGYYGPMFFDLRPVSGGAVDGLGISPLPFWRGWGWGGNSGQLLAFDVSKDTTPQFVSEVNLATNNWWGFSAPFTTNGSVYLSHSASESYVAGTNYWISQQPVQTTVTNYVTVTNYAKIPRYETVTNVDTLESYTIVAVNRLPGVDTNAAGSDAAKIAAGAFHSLGLAPDRTVSTWGWNRSGQLGDGTTSDRRYLAVLPGLSNLVAVAGGGAHSLALTVDGTVWAWGDDFAGQLGDGATATSTTNQPPVPILFQDNPVPVSGLDKVVAIAAGYAHSLALKGDGSVWAWGDNQFGQLGDGTFDQRNRPVAIPGLSNVTAIAAGYFHSLALDANGTVWAWGKNDSGQVGDGATVDRNLPVPVSSLSPVKTVVAGTRHSLALAGDGSVWAWGDNANGQLGDGTSTNRYRPVAVIGLDGVVALAASTFNLALRSDGSVWGWGDNGFDQLARGAKSDYNQPQRIPGLADVVSVAAGLDHSLALKADGAVWAWGNDDHDQLGGYDRVAQTYTTANLTNYTTVTNVGTVTLYTVITNYVTVSKVVTTTTYITITNSSPIVNYITRSYLDVVDYSDAANPTARDAVNIPGPLQGLGYGGALLYTVGQHWTTNGVTDGSDWLEASAYDGVSAHLVDSLMLSTNWPHPVLVQGTNLFIGHPADSTNAPNQLQVWTLPDTGKFTEVGAVPLVAPASTLAGFVNLLAVQETDQRIELFNSADATNLKPAGSGKPNGCLGYDLNTADGRLGGLSSGLWLPLGDYGTAKINSTPAPSSP
ncbi:MAG: RCC1 domain-containing protein [Limisphaerales bacterium]